MKWEICKNWFFFIPKRYFFIPLKTISYPKFFFHTFKVCFILTTKLESRMFSHSVRQEPSEGGREKPEVRLSRRRRKPFQSSSRAARSRTMPDHGRLGWPRAAGLLLIALACPKCKALNLSAAAPVHPDPMSLPCGKTFR